MKLRYLLPIVSLLPVTFAPASAITLSGMQHVAAAVGPCGNPCVVSGNSGGRIVSFKSAGDAIRNGSGQPLVISGYCASACMVMAARARPRVCITSTATFAYHKTNWNRPIPLSADLHRWVMQHGGYPEFRGTPGVMPNDVARRFFRTC